LALALALAALPVLPAGCEHDPERITVAGAASARRVLPELAAAFEREHGGDVALLLGGSGALVDRIEAGTRVDVVLIGDAAGLDRLAGEGRLEREGRAAVAGNRLVLVARAARPPAVTFSRLAALPSDQAIAIGNPDHSAAGLDARRLLERLDLWDELRPRLLLRGDVAAALAAVRRGQAGVAIVYQTDAAAAGDLTVLDRAGPPPAPRLWVALTPAGARRQRARAFARFLTSPAARAILERHRFDPP
ncbi:MAG TPA: molybdate ABC transporter substrate-binding protein, partial [Kofleriaceae bacterium]|nr:molybdate ABC transporter substrate-binding protein [Kofleriaceae bacterium]